MYYSMTVNMKEMMYILYKILKNCKLIVFINKTIQWLCCEQMFLDCFLSLWSKKNNTMVYVKHIQTPDLTPEPTYSSTGCLLTFHHF